MIDLDSMSDDDKLAALESIHKSIAESKEVQKQKIAANVDLVLQALKKMESDIRARYDETGKAIEKRVANIKDGRDGRDGVDGKAGKDGRPGRDGLQGPRGIDGLNGSNGIDGQDGISITDAHIDFDGSLIITLSDGKLLNVGEVVSQDIAEKIKVIQTMSTNGAVGIKDEGSSISTGVKNINFVGAAITASASGDDVTVNVSSGTGTVTSVAATGGTGISVSGSPITTSGTLTITNTAPDQTVALTQGGTTTITGTYPNFTISSADQFVGTVTSVTGTSPVASSGGTTPAISLASGYGDTLNPYASKTANFVLAAPNGTAGVPTFRAVVAADIPTLNQSTTGNAATVTTNANLTGAVTSVGNATSLGSFTSAQLAAALTDETGTGASVFATSPTLVTPALGTPASGVVTNLTGTASININGTVGATTASTGAFTTLSASGVTTVQAGTAALPAITTTGDTNTGIFFPAADTIAFAEGGAEAVRIDSAGNMGIGTSSPSTYANGFGPVLVTGTGNNFATVQGRTDGPSGAANGVSYGGSYQTNAINGARMFLGAAGSGGQRGLITFNTKDLDDNSTQPLERMRIAADGTWMLNTTDADAFIGSSTGQTGFSYRPGLAPRLSLVNDFYINRSNGDGNIFEFRRNGSAVGTITVSAGATAYNTSSDYRLKEAIVPMTGALAKVALLKPCTYKWKADGSDGQGFIAHELQEVVEGCVTGAKDAMDADGNPQYQGIDTSFLVATLTAAIQEQQALITALTTRITALESAP